VDNVLSKIRSMGFAQHAKVQEPRAYESFRSSEKAIKNGKLSCLCLSSLLGALYALSCIQRTLLIAVVNQEKDKVSETLH